MINFNRKNKFCKKAQIPQINAKFGLCNASNIKKQVNLTRFNMRSRDKTAYFATSLSTKIRLTILPASISSNDHNRWGRSIRFIVRQGHIKGLRIQSVYQDAQ